MSIFPSILSTIPNPTATNKLNSPSHSSIESAQNDAITKLETFVGTLSSTQGTLMYDIRATTSDGGGHVQVANKGGTGQTAYTKGDILVATSSSVLSKLAVGSNDQALLADSAQAAGVKWSGVVTATQVQNQTYTYARASVMSGSVYGVVLGQAVSILSDGLSLVIKFPTANATSIVAITVNATGPSSVTGLVKTPTLSNLAVGDIQPSMVGVLKFDSVSSVFQMVSPLGLGYVNYSGASAVVGWSSTTTKLIFYKEDGRTVFVWFDLEGTSNSTSTSFTLPSSTDGASIDNNFVFNAIDNGATVTNPMGQIAGQVTASSIVTLFTTIGGGGWTASGSKKAKGQFFYNKA